MDSRHPIEDDKALGRLYRDMQAQANRPKGQNGATMQIEVCTNVEWWRVFGPLGDSDDDAIEAAINDVFSALDDAGFESVHAGGQRMSCNGWNGANTFRRKSCWGIGTFETMTDEE